MNRRITAILIFLLAAACPAARTSASSAASALDDSGSAAETLTNTALERNPSDPRAHYNKGVLLHRQGKLDEAASHFSKALGLAMGGDDTELRARAFHNLGNTDFLRGKSTLFSEPGQTLARWKASRDDFKAALELDPSSRNARRNLELLDRKIRNLERNLNASAARNADDLARMSKDLEQLLQEVEQGLQDDAPEKEQEKLDDIGDQIENLQSQANQLDDPMKAESHRTLDELGQKLDQLRQQLANRRERRDLAGKLQEQLGQLRREVDKHNAGENNAAPEASDKMRETEDKLQDALDRPESGSQPDQGTALKDLASERRKLEEQVAAQSSTPKPSASESAANEKRLHAMQRQLERLDGGKKQAKDDPSGKQDGSGQQPQQQPGQGRQQQQRQPGQEPSGKDGQGQPDPARQPGDQGRRQPGGQQSSDASRPGKPGQEPSGKDGKGQPHEKTLSQMQDLARKLARQMGTEADPRQGQAASMDPNAPNRERANNRRSGGTESNHLLEQIRRDRATMLIAPEGDEKVRRKGPDY